MISLVSGTPVNGRATATALGLEKLVVPWRKPDLVKREQIYAKTQRIHAE